MLPQCCPGPCHLGGRGAWASRDQGHWEVPLNHLTYIQQPSSLFAWPESVCRISACSRYPAVASSLQEVLLNLTIHRSPSPQPRPRSCLPHHSHRRQLHHKHRCDRSTAPSTTPTAYRAARRLDIQSPFDDPLCSFPLDTCRLHST